MSVETQNGTKNTETYKRYRLVLLKSDFSGSSVTVSRVYYLCFSKRLERKATGLVGVSWGFHLSSEKLLHIIYGFVFVLSIQVFLGETVKLKSEMMRNTGRWINKVYFYNKWIVCVWVKMIFCLCYLWHTALNSRVPAYDVNQNFMLCFFVFVFKAKFARIAGHCRIWKSMPLDPCRKCFREYLEQGISEYLWK